MQATSTISDPEHVPASPVSAVMLILAAFALGQAIHVNNGSWHPMAMAWLTLSILATVFGLRSIPSHRASSIFKISLKHLIGVFLIIQWGQLLLWGIGSRRSYSEPIWIFITAIVIAGVGTIGLLISAAPTNALAALAVSQIRPFGVLDSRNRDSTELVEVKRHISLLPAFTLLLLAHFLAGAYVIRGMIPPHIDVWNFQQDSTAALMHGQNPYTVRYRNIYEPANDYGPGTSVGGWMTFSFPYPPLTLLFDIPGRLLGDIRWSHLLALEAAAALIGLTWRNQFGFLAAAMLLLNPSSLFVIYSAWTEPMVILTFAAMLYCARHKPSLLWLPLGLFIAGKQYAIFVAPLALLAFPRSVFFKSLTLAAAITLPFIWWNPAAFFHSTLLMLLHAPLRLDGLTFSALIARLTGLQAPSWLGLLAIGVVSLWAWRRFPRTPFAWTAATALALLLFFAFTKQAFCNYYFLVIGFLSSAVAMTSTQSIASSERSDSNQLQPKRLAA